MIKLISKLNNKMVRKSQTGSTLTTIRDIPFPSIDGYEQTSFLRPPQPTYAMPDYSQTFGQQLQPFNGNLPQSIQKILGAAQQGKFYSTGAKKYMSLGQDKYKHKCTSGPATFYKDSLGIKLNGLWWDTGDPKTAKKTNITKAGFTEKWAGDGSDVRNGSWKNTVRPGDIMVIFSSNSGHAQMWDGTKWVSDTNQSNAWCYGKDNGRAGKRSAIIYRNDNLWA